MSSSRFTGSMDVPGRGGRLTAAAGLSEPKNEPEPESRERPKRVDRAATASHGTGLVRIGPKSQRPRRCRCASTRARAARLLQPPRPGRRAVRDRRPRQAIALVIRRNWYVATPPAAEEGLYHLVPETPWADGPIARAPHGTQNSYRAPTAGGGLSCAPGDFSGLPPRHRSAKRWDDMFSLRGYRRPRTSKRHRLQGTRRRTMGKRRYEDAAEG